MEEKTILLMFIILTTVSFVLVKPLMSRLAMLVEAMAREKSEPRVLDEVSHLRELLERLEARVSLMEERQDFTDALLGDSSRKSGLLAATDRSEDSGQ